ncbi:MAG TPA: hypothetical protein VJX67_02345, partial [Blastocatellia bacterium]|nr:hypothetical protein [Blastocatellia bacterium]
MADFTILEPISTGDVIDRSVRLYRRNFTPLISIVVIPSLIYYVSSLLFWTGYARLILEAQSGGTGAPWLLMVAVGGMGYIVALFTLVAAVAGMARVIGDYVMTGEPITFRKAILVVKRRLGDIALMVLLVLLLGFAAYVVFIIAVFIVVFLGAIVVALITAVSAPPWLNATVGTICVLALVAAGTIGLLMLVSRFIFLPQVLMIEGQSAGSALGRAIALGKKNWYRVGGIALFCYFVTLSLLAALTLPLLAGVEVWGTLGVEMLSDPKWTALYAGFNQISSLLVMPIWTACFTLLYFDSRVRNEAYDIEVLSIGLQPSPQ